MLPCCVHASLDLDCLPCVRAPFAAERCSPKIAIVRHLANDDLLSRDSVTHRKDLLTTPNRCRPTGDEHIYEYPADECCNTVCGFRAALDSVLDLVKSGHNFVVLLIQGIP